MDSIIISDLEVLTHIGVPEVERKTAQRILDTAASDDIKHAIDYAIVAEQIQELAQTERKTIELFTEDIAHMVLTQFKPSSVTITAKKYILPDANHVAVTITRP